jgi:response regulator NasT
MTMQQRVLLVNENPERARLLKQSLQTFGHSVVAEAMTGSDLVASADRYDPDVLLIESDSLGGSLLSKLQELSRHRPMPVVLFTAQADHEAIHAAVRAGVSGYVVDGFQTKRIGTIVEVAIARFRETQRLRQELHETRTSLSERKAVERAKGILMKQRGCDEPEAYHALRKMAMDKNLRIGQAAENVIAVAELLN